MALGFRKLLRPGDSGHGELVKLKAFGGVFKADPENAPSGVRARGLGSEAQSLYHQAIRSVPVTRQIS